MVMTMTASARLFQSRAWILSISGQVATTIMVAQTAAGRNGCRIQNEAAVSPTIRKTAKVVRVRSCLMSPIVHRPVSASKEPLLHQKPGYGLLSFKQGRFVKGHRKAGLPD